MVLKAVPGSLFPVSIKTGTSTWTVIDGVDTVVPTPNSKDADTTMFSNAGWTSSMVVSRGLEVKVSGKAVWDKDTNEKDPGQAAVELLALELGSAAEGVFRIALPGDKAIEFTADVKDCVPFTNAAAEDVAKWECTLKVSAKPTIVSVAQTA